MTVTDEYIRLLAEEGNGAVETALPDGQPLMIVIVGPIKTWWGRMDSEEYIEYASWRDAVRVEVIHKGHLVYSPHRAWQGAWHEAAQRVNDAAIIESDAVIVVTPENVEAVGTAAEIAVAEQYGKPVIYAPPGAKEELRNVVSQLEKIFPVYA